MGHTWSSISLGRSTGLHTVPTVLLTVINWCGTDLGTWGLITTLCGGTWTLGGFCTFLFQLKSSLSHSESQAVTQISRWVFSRSRCVPSRFGSWGRNLPCCSPLPPTLPKEASWYWIESHRATMCQFGAALALLNDKHRAEEHFLPLTPTEWRLQSSFHRTDKINSNWSSFFFNSDHSAAYCSTRRKKLLHLSVWLICMRPRLSDLPHNNCVPTFLTQTHAKLIRQEKELWNSISLLLSLFFTKLHTSVWEQCVLNRPVLPIMGNHN